MKPAVSIVKIGPANQGIYLRYMHALAERAVPLVQRIALRRGRTIDYLLDRDFDPSFHDFLYHPIDVFDHFDRDFDALLDDLLDNSIDMLDHFDWDFDAPLDKLGFYGGK
jgi:hypothetical protein